jgi:cyclase
VDHAIACERLGCGEILLTSIDRDGCGGGYDEQLLAEVAAAVTVPVIARGGASSREHFRAALDAGASAVAAGNLFVYWGPRRAVLVNYPDELRC